MALRTKGLFEKVKLFRLKLQSRKLLKDSWFEFWRNLAQQNSLKSEWMIPDFPEPPFQIVLEPSAIALLYKEKYRQLLGVFMPQPRSVSEAAKLLTRDLKRTFNDVQTLVKHGLLQEMPSAGRMRFYQAVAQNYFMPFAASSFTGYGELLQDQLQDLQKAMLHSLEQFLEQRHPSLWGTRFFLDPDGKTHFALTPKDNWQQQWLLSELLQADSPALMHFFGRLQLLPSQAKDLQLELAQLWQRYYFLSLEPDEQKTTFGLGLGLAPI